MRKDSTDRLSMEARFLQRGSASLASAKRTGIFMDLAVTLRKLELMLAEAQAVSKARRLRGK